MHIREKVFGSSGLSCSVAHRTSHVAELHGRLVALARLDSRLDSPPPRSPARYRRSILHRTQEHQLSEPELFRREGRDCHLWRRGRQSVWLGYGGGEFSFGLSSRCSAAVADVAAAPNQGTYESSSLLTSFFNAVNRGRSSASPLKHTSARSCGPPTIRKGSSSSRPARTVKSRSGVRDLPPHDQITLLLLWGLSFFFPRLTAVAHSHGDCCCVMYSSCIPFVLGS